MVEKNFQTLFTSWARLNPPKVTTVWELKLAKGPSIAFDRVYDHQVAGLRAAKRGLYHKIADSPFIQNAGKFMRFTKPKPFDCWFIAKAEAYVVILFYKPLQTKRMIFIEVDRWVKEKNSSKRKSLTEDRAEEISHHIIAL